MAPKPATIQPPTLGRPVTRVGNKDRHPAIDTGYRKDWITRRTPEEIAIAKEEEESAKRREKAEQKRLIQAAASIEDRQREEDLRYELEANHPHDPPLVPSTHASDEDEEDVPEDPSHADSDGSFVGGDEEDEPEDFSADEAEPEVPRGRPKTKADKAKRDDIKASRKTQSQSGTPQVKPAAGKRKASASSAKSSSKAAAAKKAKTGKKSGLASNLKSAAGRRTPSSASGRSSPMAVDSEDDDRAVRPGGPALDDDANEQVERRGKKSKRGKPNESDYIKITVPPRPPTLKELRNGRSKWTLDDLPHGAARLFKEVLTPLACVIMGEQDNPWESFSEDQVQTLLTTVYGDDTEYSAQDPVWGGLIAYRLNDWRHSIADRAIAAVRLLIKMATDAAAEKAAANTQNNKAKSAEGAVDQDEDEETPVSFDLSTPEGVKAYVEWSLQEEGHTCPFHWREWNDGVQKEGLFESSLIGYTFAHQIMLIRVLSLKHYLEMGNPIGALILCIQAVDRALRAFATGTYIKSSESKDYFSKDQYNDTTKMVDGKLKKHKRCGKYLPTIKVLEDAEWQAIWEGRYHVGGREEVHRRFQSILIDGRRQRGDFVGRGRTLRPQGRRSRFLRLL
ncbi:hypothetical protein C8F04DRAFT_1407090 [Mycena alexandri]|uniref:Uncharacterized protein n=1 Tax=Mycena alexandri TaxID=1745969 RepID=A0AAD6RWU5_9AGAR|nr:hypothetical protein C8F04DRAFT_1407090 [Mycena alexandri]